MRRIRSKGTSIELTVRRVVHSLGYRYRLHDKALPGIPDLVFRPRQKIIFVHGCFWHQHQAEFCAIVRRPKSNQAYWFSKLERNKNRDAEHVAGLEQAGWEVLTLWECEVAGPRDQLESRITSFLG
jgi:DNA mismatch endonuclease (patch repair protein)